MSNTDCPHGYRTFFDGCGSRCTGCLTVIGSIGWACAPRVRAEAEIPQRSEELQPQTDGEAGTPKTNEPHE